MTTRKAPRPEFSRVVPLDDLTDAETVREIEANEGERAGLAMRFGLLSLDSLRATVRLKRLRGGRAVRFSAVFHAEVTQTCVATLEPVADRIDDAFEIVFEREAAGAGGRELVLDPEADSEPLVGDSIDIGEVVAQEVALSLNPYPRRPGATLDTGDGALDAERGPGAPGPFESLAALKRKY